MEKDLMRAEFLKKNSPIKKNNEDAVTPPPLFSAEEKQSILGDNEDLKESKTPNQNLEKLRFWRNWNERQYTMASVALAAMLVVYVGVSVAGLSFDGDTSLNATLEVENNFENNTEVTEEESDEVIREDVVDSTMVIEDIENDSSEIEEPNQDITEYIFENYNF